METTDITNKKKILVIALSLSEKNGQGRYSLSLIYELRKYYDLIIVTGQEEIPELPGCKIYPILPVMQGFLKLRNPLIAIPAIWRIFCLARKERINWVHSMMDYPHSFLALIVARLLRRPLFVTAHGTYSIKPFNWLPDKWFLAYTFRQARRIFPVSRFTEAAIKKRVPTANTLVVNNGIDFDKFAKRHAPASSAIGPRLLGVGALKSRKGFHISIAAVARVKEKYPNIVYIIVGEQSDQNYFQSLQDLVKKLGLESNVIFVQDITDKQLVDYYQSVDLFILTSIYINDNFEGFGLVFLEAGACFKPVIGTRGCGAEDAIIDGQTGLLVAQNNIIETSQAILRILDNADLAESMGQAGHELAKQMTWANQIAKIRAEYEKVPIKNK